MKEIYLKDMEIQWHDHFHMRDQTWKILQYTILLFLGAVGLEIKEGMEQYVVLLAHVAVSITSALGFIVALHHRNRQNLKFDLIKLYEDKLELTPIIKDILTKHEAGFMNQINTSTYIVVAQTGLFLVSLSMLIARLYSYRDRTPHH